MSLITRETTSVPVMSLYLAPFDPNQVYCYSDINKVINYVRVIARSYNQVSLIKVNRDTGEALTTLSTPIILPIQQFIDKLVFTEIDQVFRKFQLDQETIVDVRIDKSNNSTLLVNIINQYNEVIRGATPVLMETRAIREILQRVAFNSTR